MTSAARRPLIGVTLDSEQPGGYSKYPWYALRENYAEAVAAAGGLPIALPHEPALAADYLDRIDALVVTGGAFDVDPALFGEPPATRPSRSRTAAPRSSSRSPKARSRATCRCSASAAASSFCRRARRHADPAHPRRGRRRAGARAAQPAPRARPYGRDRGPAPCSTGSSAPTEMRVNTAHHQAVHEPGAARRRQRGRARRRHRGHRGRGARFCLGVQWHPEVLHRPGDRRIFAALIAACG